MTDAAGHRQDARGEDPGAGRDRRHPGGGEAARRSSRRAGRDHAAARARPQARAAGSTTSSASTRSRRCARRPRAGELRDAQGFGAKSRRTCSRALDAGVAERPAPRIVLSRRSRSASRSPTRCARTRPPTASRSPARARRLADTAKDLDIIATATDPAALAAALAELDVVESRGRAGEARRAARDAHRPGIDLRVVEPDQFGNLLQHFTGSARHNVALREAAVRRGLHVSEYGILDDATGETLRCATEEEVYERLGLPWIPPELREGRGELEPAASRCRRARDRRGPRAATCTATRRCPTAAARSRRWRAARAGARLRVPRDHRPLGVARLRQPRDAGRAAPPDRAGARRSTSALDGITLLVGTESNILPDGSLDYDDELLAELDWVIGSVHTSFGMDERRR